MPDHPALALIVMLLALHEGAAHRCLPWQLRHALLRSVPESKTSKRFIRSIQKYAKAVAPGIAEIEQTRTHMNKHFMKNNLKHDQWHFDLGTLLLDWSLHGVSASNPKITLNRRLISGSLLAWCWTEPAPHQAFHQHPFRWRQLERASLLAHHL